MVFDIIILVFAALLLWSSWMRRDEDFLEWLPSLFIAIGLGLSVANLLIPALLFWCIGFAVDAASFFRGAVRADHAGSWVWGACCIVLASVYAAFLCALIVLPTLLS